MVAALLIVDSHGTSSTLQRILPNNLPGVLQLDVWGGVQLCVFPTMLSLRPFDEQQDMWSESADLNLMFPSAEAEITFIYMQDVFTDSDSM